MHTAIKLSHTQHMPRNLYWPVYISFRPVNDISYTIQVVDWRTASRFSGT